MNQMKRVWLFDWDDSLLPSTWLKRLEVFYGPAVIDLIRPFLETLQDRVCILIDSVCRYGYVPFIVTNAEREWIEHSCRKYMPKVLTAIEDYRISVVSARSLYALEHPQIFNANVPHLWKHEAFAQVLKDFEPVQKTHLITHQLDEESESIYDLCGYIPLASSIFELDPNYMSEKRENSVELVVMGDSIFDMNAAYSVGSYDWIKLKTIKLVEWPDVQTLIQELVQVCERLERIHSAPSTIFLSVTQLLAPPGGLMFHEEQNDAIKINVVPINFIPIRFDLLEAQVQNLENTNLVIPNAPEMTEVCRS